MALEKYRGLLYHFFPEKIMLNAFDRLRLTAFVMLSLSKHRQKATLQSHGCCFIMQL